MEGTCKELILDGLSSLFEQGNFSDLLALLKIYDENPGEILTRTPEQLQLSHSQRSSTLKITEIIAFVHTGFKNIPVENLIIPTLLSCIELAMWKDTEFALTIKTPFVYFLPVFIDFYYHTSRLKKATEGDIEKIEYFINKLLYSRYEKLTSEIKKNLISSVSRKKLDLYRKYKGEKWFGFPSFILTEENNIVESLRNK